VTRAVQFIAFVGVAVVVEIALIGFGRSTG
jgi:hypothetical protein